MDVFELMTNQYLSFFKSKIMNSKKLFIVILFRLISGFSNAQTAPNILDLSGVWKLTWANGGHGPKSIEQLAAQEPFHDPFKYVDAEVPREIHDVFNKYGVVDDPNIGVNLLHADWVGDQYYQYYRTFNLPAEAIGQEQWLVFDQLDLVADIYLNGEKVGSHQNAFHPVRRAFDEVVVVLTEEGENINIYGVNDKPEIDIKPD